ncbi:hypothetical protein GWA97_10145 [Flavobacterium sp. LaA7.5]|nr:hypothetical protein [Flavobacterium salilacus subsp. altitudinum]
MKPKYGFEINIPEGDKIVKIPTSPKLQKYLKENFFKGKSYVDYIKEFLITEKRFNTINTAFIKTMRESIPGCLKLGCIYCSGKSNDDNDKACQKYYLQMEITYAIAASEFVNLIISNRHIYDNKQILLDVTHNFFKCFYFVKNKGLMYFDLEKMCMYTLNAGFLSISQILAKSSTLNNLRVINEHITYFDEKKLENKIFNKEDENYLDLQTKFYEDKQRFYKEKLF